ncbi:unnamed protein product [Rhizoctonia solani]|uniref:Uncharacterized protein n=1 Tax=Rhizoctonia solani TaxID=456999 RepID=A0A8H3DPL7_9AGAM|nr:unnamed protein product [Rhizoctonia solani]
MTQYRNCFNADALRPLRGKYSSVLGTLRAGERAIRNSLHDQLAMLKVDARDTSGDCPTLIGEIGVLFDMDKKKSYGSDGDSKYVGYYTDQTPALDCSPNGADGNNVSKFPDREFVCQPALLANVLAPSRSLKSTSIVRGNRFPNLALAVQHFASSVTVCFTATNLGADRYVQLIAPIILDDTAVLTHHVTTWHNMFVHVHTLRCGSLGYQMIVLLVGTELTSIPLPQHGLCQY